MRGGGEGERREVRGGGEGEVSPRCERVDSPAALVRLGLVIVRSGHAVLQRRASYRGSEQR